ncbi:hypothetical protein A3K24_02920 [candidate division Kazan bacterium RIFCSPHIGHO2_01_FULL_44_14]|uniref:Uncharacterized protein n=1 Tax=candidate division Kazan bacterium RIFCSPLOWO2_01_FULL_45_19 TaxID=1798538 RepID=A0A1F4NR80_UNCK3|nr:hypothetical protein [uncultured bacterium]OGB73758.1 MAG: hypothetical protein A3K51_02920 [candidate division Kazan bacterium RIFCSPLOWO2_01_FULL_45_19]OGB78003.1 MAG: hypothetical protein A3K24_02920 [candidate division Kazan bacterium RIFCSPHIGHO2_01_FULL_44_14]
MNGRSSNYLANKEEEQEKALRAGKRVGRFEGDVHHLGGMSALAPAEATASSKGVSSIGLTAG